MSWRRILLLSLIFVVALCGATWAILQRSGAATSIVQRKLAEALATPATIESTELDLAAGRLIVHGLRVEDPTRPGAALARARRIDLDADLDLGDLVTLRRIGIAGLEIDIGRNPPTLAQLIRSTGEASGGGRLPALEISDAQMQLACIPGEQPIILEKLGLSATPLDGEPHILTLRGNASLVGLDASLAVKGHVNSSTGETELLATVLDWPLDTPCLRWLEDRLDVDLGQLDVAGRLRKLEILFTASADAAGERSVRIEARGAITGARMSGPNLPKHLRSAAITFVASTDNNGDLTVKIAQNTEHGELDIACQITDLAGDPSFSVRAKGKNLAIDEDTCDALRLFPVGNSVVDALQPESGRADLDLYLRDPHRRTGLAEFEMTVRDCVLAYYGYGSREDRIGFPLPLVEARGTVRLRNDVVELDDLSAKIAPSAGGGTVTLSGRIDTLASATESSTLDIHARGVSFTSDLRSAIANLLDDDGALYDRLAPSGTADVDVSIRPMTLLAGGFAVTIRPRSATVTWGGFPYRLDDIRGTIVVRAADADFDLEGRHGNGTVTMLGRIPLQETHDELAGFEVAVELTNLRVDDELRAAVAVMAPAINDTWVQCAPTGQCSGFVRAWRPSMAADLHFDLRIAIDGVDLKLPVEPWRARDLSGQLLIAGSGDEARIDFGALRGQLDHGAGPPAKLAMLGQVHYGATPRSDLSLVVRGLELDAELGSTLETLRALGPGVWDYLDPSGSVDLVCRHRLQPDGSDALSLVVHLLDVGSNAAILPRPARNMTGELHITDGHTTFEELRADLGGNLVRCLDGSISTAPAPDGRTRLSFTVTAADFPLGDGLARLFPGPLSKTIVERRLSGSADIDRLRLSFAIPTEGSTMPFETVLSGQLRLQDVGLTLGTGSEGFRIDRLFGTVKLDESRISATEGQLAGALSGASLRMFDQPFESLSGRFTADAMRMELSALETRFHGGLVKQRDGDSPAVIYVLPSAEAPDGRLRANLAFESVDVHSFLVTAGWVSPPYRGSARGHMVLERLDGHDIVDAVGSGALAIERGNLGGVPLFTAIYRLLPAPERPRFDQLGLELRLQDRRVSFDNLVLRSNLLAATGSGTLDLDGYLDVKVTLNSLLGNTADPLFMPLIDFFANNIVRFHLYGHRRDLKAEARWITESSPERPPVPPLPPISNRRPIPDY